MGNIDFVSIGLDITSVIPAAIILILLQTHLHRHKEKRVHRLFSALLWIVIGIAAADAITKIFHLEYNEDTTILEYLAMSSFNILTTVFSLVWLGYVEYRLYLSKDYLKRRFWIYVSPLIAMVLMTVIAAYTFPYTDSIVPRILAVAGVLASYILNLIYIITSLIRLYQYKKQNGTMRFFKISFFLIPFLISQILILCSRHSYHVLSLAIGISLLYISIVNEYKYMDQETGFYNAKYIEFVSRLIGKTKYILGSIMVFDIDDPDTMRDFSRILKKQLPRSCEPVRSKGDQIIVFSKIADRSALHMATEDVEIAVDEWNGKPDNMPIVVDTAYDIKKKNEKAEDFLARFFSKQEM